MRDPVIGSDGRSYERTAIIHWLRSNPCSPLTRQPMTASSLKPNYALKSAIDRFLALPTAAAPQPSAPPADDVYFAMNVYQQDLQQQALLRYGPQTSVQPAQTTQIIVLTPEQLQQRRKVLGGCVCFIVLILLIVIVSRIYLSMGN